MSNVFIDVTVIEPKMKHATVFDAFDHIAEGEAVVLHNDHDPKPLYYQLMGERGNCFSWTYLRSGPEIWKVEIKKSRKSLETIGEIAGSDIRKMALLKKMDIDFCCTGKKSLEEVCTEKGLDILRVRQELEDTIKQATPSQQTDFKGFSISSLVDYILNVHHQYVKNNSASLYELSDKVAAHHGAQINSLIDLRNKTHELLKELSTHLKKEEQILFLFIKMFESKDATNTTGLDSIKNPIWMMERDHDIFCELVKDIRKITNHYVSPEGSCNSVSLLFTKLREFEDNLLQHIHLENNILFPKAIAIEGKAQ